MLPGMTNDDQPPQTMDTGYTHQGSIVPVHLQSYLEEFTFRFNRRNSRSRGLVFRRLIEQAMVTEPVTEADVTFGYDWNEKKGRRS